jgi:hypothetical protein
MPRKRQEVFGQQKLDIGEGTSQTWTPSPEVVSGAKKYAASHGREVSSEGLGTIQHQARTAYATHLERRKNEGQPMTPDTSASYDALRQGIGEQFAHLTTPKHQGGMGFHFEATSHDPYPTAEHMAADVAQGRIKVLSTASTGGHGLLSDLENDQFRAVHDVFGHAATGRGFSRHGEEAAYQHHAQMFAPEARPALSAELRSQTASLIFSGDFPPNAPVNLPKTGRMK